MNVHFVTTNQIRTNLSAITLRLKKKKERIFVTKNKQPIFEIKQLSKKEIAKLKMLETVRQAEDDIKMGRVYSTDEIRKKFGLV